MIYFDENKNAFASPIENPIATIDDETWAKYASNPDKWDIINDKFIDITNTDDYKAKQRKQLIQSEEVKKAAIFSKVADSILTDDLQLKAGKITQAVHDSRLTAKLAIYKQAEDNFYTNTGLERPAIIGA